MRAWPLLLIGLVACGKGGGGSAKPTTFTHEHPAFALDVPSDYKARPEVTDPIGTTLSFDGPHASQSIIVSWRPADGFTAVQKRDSLVESEMATGKPKPATGEVAGGAAWMQTTNPMGDLVEVFLLDGDTMVDCQGNGKAPVIDACKSLRPR